MADKFLISEYLKQLQDNICGAIENTDTKGKFTEDIWQHTSGGGGRTRVIENGKIIEKGGVNFSAVEGVLSPALQKQLGIEQMLDFFATGVSIVMHPENPHVPIIHMNVRYFELSNGKCWFGGGIDLTPHYIVDEQAKWFHTQLKNACNLHHPAFYSKFKEWADDYFYLPHRNETRGIGGIFYDYLRPDEKILKTDSIHSKNEIFDFMKSVGESFAPIYTHLMQINFNKPFSENQKKWQLIRRGRYVEFNLVWDRGTKFGLETNGRTESILMSLPPHADWNYNFKTQENSMEDHTLSKLKKGINWV
jgi:coproporphyrinogen III oxidase